MKRFFIFLATILLAVSVSAQHHDHHAGYRSGPQGGRHVRYENRHDQHRGHGRDPRNDRRYEPRGGHGKGHSGHGNMRPDIPCTRDWQELWNGCHVRIKLDRVSVYNRRDDRIIWGDEVFLLGNGCYKVRNGGFWYVHGPDGSRLSSVWGDFVNLMPNGLFHCRRAGMDFYYDVRGNERR